MIYKILLSVSLSRNKEGNYLVHCWVLSPPRCRGMHLIIKPSNVTKEPTCGQQNRRTGNPFLKSHCLNDWMMKKRHRWSSVLSEMGQGRLMGSICCTWIPFILVAINQSHLSPLLKSYSANPPVDPKTHFGTGTIELFFVMFSHNPLCLPTYVLCLALFFHKIMPYRTFLSRLWCFCLLSAPLWFCCLHTHYCYLFLAIDRKSVV